MSVTTWANGMGEWHVRVSRDAASPLIAARKAIREEILLRHPTAAEFCWKNLIRVPDMDTADTLVYREGIR